MIRFFAIVSLLLASEVSFANASDAFILSCKLLHAGYNTRCTPTDISRNEDVGSKIFAYMYDGCKNGESVQIFADNIAATATTPPFLSCTINKIGKKGSTNEVRTSLGTTLIVYASGNKVTTTVRTKDGEISCKSHPNDSQKNAWCGVAVKPSIDYTPVAPLASSELADAFYGKKTAADYLREGTKTEKAAEAVIQ